MYDDMDVGATSPWKDSAGRSRTPEPGATQDAVAGEAGRQEQAPRAMRRNYLAESGDAGFSRVPALLPGYSGSINVSCKLQ